MKKNQQTTTTSTALILGKSKSLMGITKKILESKNKGLVKAKASQELTTHKDITIIGDLMWEKETSEEWKYWDEAMEYAKNLRLGGYDDWRLPTKEELGAVVTLCGGELVTYVDDNWRDISDKNKANEKYKANYKAQGFASDIYWSSTTYAGNSSNAWYVIFNSGYQGNDGKSNSIYIRCVRAGQ